MKKLLAVLLALALVLTLSVGFAAARDEAARRRAEQMAKEAEAARVAAERKAAADKALEANGQSVSGVPIHITHFIPAPERAQKKLHKHNPLK